MNAVNWGILATGRIAGTFAAALRELPDARLLAVGSRTAESAEAFAGENGAIRAYGGYADLMSDEDVDVIYIATPHPMHHANTIACLEHGKPVLCEKPMAINQREVREMVEVARQRDLFLMEAMWTRCLPVIRRVGEWIEEGKIGEVRMLSAAFGYRTGWDPAGRLLNPGLGGGALLDVGVYPVALAHMVFGGEPTGVDAAAHIGATGVDEQTAMTLTFAGGGLAQLACAVRTNLNQDARIDGTNGHIDIPIFWRASTATLHVEGEAATVINEPSGYHFEAAEVMDCLRAGRRQSSLMPLDETAAIAHTMDRVRSAIGLRYPMDA